MAKILIIDDEEKLRGLLARIVAHEGHEVLEASDGRSGLKKLEQQPDIEVVLCDVKLPDAHGVSLVQDLKKTNPSAEVILLTAYGNIPDGVQAIKNGAFDYLTKGDDNNRILPLLERALEKCRLARRIRQLEKELGRQRQLDQLIGPSGVMQQAVALARKVAATDTTVLLSGETGTGKEVFAQAIHQESPRKQQAFVAINCAAFSHDLLESEMFGHRAGAFTGAQRDKAGLFEEADKGTLFLDEIGEMAPDLQAKLLRVLETGEYLKVGETKTRKVDVRIIAATNRHLGEEVRLGHFRADLFYRIAVFQIALPPLRERPDDIGALALYFAEKAAQKTNRRLQEIAPAFTAALRAHTWPGNIRELKNVIERSVILMDDDGRLTPDTLPLEMQWPEAAAGDTPASLSLASAEQQHIQKVLRLAGGNKSEAARLLGIAPATLYRKLETYDAGL